MDEKMRPIDKYIPVTQSKEKTGFTARPFQQPKYPVQFTTEIRMYVCSDK